VGGRMTLRLNGRPVTIAELERRRIDGQPMQRVGLCPYDGVRKDQAKRPPKSAKPKPKPRPKQTWAEKNPTAAREARERRDQLRGLAFTMIAEGNGQVPLLDLAAKAGIPKRGIGMACMHARIRTMRVGRNRCVAVEVMPL
jgi:hypothetical protein